MEQLINKRDNIDKQMTIQATNRQELKAAMQQINCDACLIVAGTINNTFNKKEVTDILRAISTMACGFKLDLGVCKGFIDYYADGVLENVFDINLHPGYICQTYLKICTFDQFKEEDPMIFVRDVLKDKPEIIQDDEFVNKLYDDVNKHPAGRKTLKMVHITDIHLDLKYAAGSNNQCRSPICCRSEYGFPREERRKAGPLGDYHCDVPMDTVVTMGEYIKEEIKPDVIFWTGDTTPHNMFEEKHFHEKFEFFEVVTDFFNETFPDVPIYPLLGNHDFEISNFQDFR